MLQKSFQDRDWDMGVAPVSYTAWSDFGNGEEPAICDEGPCACMHMSVSQSTGLGQGPREREREEETTRRLLCPLPTYNVVLCDQSPRPRAKVVHLLRGNAGVVADVYGGAKEGLHAVVPPRPLAHRFVPPWYHAGVHTRSALGGGVRCEGGGVVRGRCESPRRVRSV